MCGIVGYVGKKQAAPILLNGLAKLEYRGYDSAGIAVENKGDRIEVIKAKGRLSVLSDMTDGGKAVAGSCGIGHTRWATHGEPSGTNAHPHVCNDKTIAVVHNGIIENYLELKDKLIKNGAKFVSETDTEVIAHLLKYYYTGDPMDAITKVMMHVSGSYAFGIMFHDHPGEIYAVRKDSPLIVGHSKDGNFIASDVPAILEYTRDVYYIQNMEICVLKEDSIKFYNIDKEELEKEVQHIEWDAKAAEKEGFEHYMMKEIYEQPKAITDTIAPRIKDGKVVFEELGLTDEELKGVEHIVILGCGSAYHVGLNCKYVLENLTRIPVDVELASEFRYRNPIIHKNTCVIVISQSGETADSLAALREAKKLGAKVIAVVNVVGSSIAREADATIYTWAGPEISVATTKAYSTQMVVLYMLGMLIGDLKGLIKKADYENLITELQSLPEKVQRILDEKERIQWFAHKYAAAQDIFFIGRGIDYAACMEGSLKLKEISYIHSEAYAAGELKHGTISLIENNILVVSLATQSALYGKTVSNIVEVKSRGAFVFGVTSAGNYTMEDVADFTVYVPKTNELFMTSLTVIPLQLFAYYVSCAKGLDVDKPRNLAKSVTVE
ncbi:MAG: glutamine--fructose-6-phosphate transaminase (isomerizing) [Acetatifactor sp.]|nr:glutamine--fructose-6-phosphate transaminase (isomerizing) [Acetatifactor sp.]